MFPPYLADVALWLSFVPIAVVGLLVAAIMYGVLVATGRRASAATILLPTSAFLLLGLVAGYLTGLSREPAVGAVLPAALTLIGGVAAALIGNSHSRTLVLRVSGLILAFSSGLFIGTAWGSAMRQAIDDFNSSESELIRRSQVEAVVREFRIARGLPPEMPTTNSGSKKDKEK